MYKSVNRTLMVYLHMEIKLFGIARDIAGEHRIVLKDTAGIQTVRDLKARLVETYPDLGKLRSLAVAVDQEYAEDTDALGPDHEVALIPPVSGG